MRVFHENGEGRDGLGRKWCGLGTGAATLPATLELIAQGD